MIRIQRYAKPATWREALAMAADDPAARWLAGGTFLLAGDGRDRPESMIDLASALPAGVENRDSAAAIGAGTTFQDLCDSPGAPRCLVEAAFSMLNRNTRNRATVGGNLGADKSCSSLIPILLVLEARLEVASPSSPEPLRISLERWLAERDSGARGSSDLVLEVLVPDDEEKRAAYRRWSRVACDLSVLGAAAAYELEGGSVANLRIALGGLGPRSRRAPDIEALFEGRPLPSRGEIEEVVAPRLRPVTDFRASADFKRLRGAQLIADAILEARPEEEA